MLKFDVATWVATKHFVSSTKSRFHNATCCTKQQCSACVFAKWAVHNFVWKVVEIQTVCLDESCKFTCCQNCVNVYNAISKCAEFFALLCCTWHDGNNVNVLWIDALLFSVNVLDHCTKHVLWRFATREVWQKVWVVVLDVVDPTWATTCKHWKLSTVLDTTDKFRCFLHDCEVSSAVNVKHFVKTAKVKCAYHLAFYVCANWVTKFFAKSSANGWCRANNNVLSRVCKCLSNTSEFVLFYKCASWANCDTLTTTDTWCVCKVHIKCCADVSSKTTFVSADNANCLCLVANGNTSTAKDALCVVTDEVLCGSILWFFVHLTCKSVAVTVVFVGKFLQFAVCVTVAGKTIFLVVGKDQFQCSLA